MYTVHVFPTKERREYRAFRLAFEHWKGAAKKHRGVALWCFEGKWTRVYATEGYPERLSRPWQCK